MKKTFENLKLNKEVISKLESNKVNGGGGTHCCPTLDALNTCPPPGIQCY